MNIKEKDRIRENQCACAESFLNLYFSRVRAQIHGSVLYILQ